ncbi:unnamed protein product [Mytilus edulis]|uniref:RWD domain-containing protein n=1 Tax=Mytilus edulis TaxID=6550 RepID=A0A8S3QR10_MYTED|nr:unnamed protein product [Mytilus edulis]
MASTDNIDMQSQEVAKVKKNFNGQCRIITDIADFSHVVTLQPKDQDIIYKFQLKKTYPSTKPNIIIRSGTMDSKAVDEIQNELEETAASALGSPMVLNLVEHAQLWLQKNNINLTPSAKTKSKTNKEKSVNKISVAKQDRKNRKEKKVQDETADEKKPSMKTSDDVVKRILWDGNLPVDEFLVGYIDRFLGIQEKYFTSFSWEDIATVDYNVLAVPKHRIQYFKYRDVKIWDKNLRMDNVFGSTGSNTTIYDVIEKYHKDSDVNNTDEMNKAEDEDYDVDDNEEDSDSDDGITVTIGSNNYATGNDEDDLHLDDEDEDTHDKYWRNKLRPNHFLALRITNNEVRKVVEGIQDVILEHEPQYEECCIPLNSLHITLCTLGLDTTEQVAHACQVLQKIKSELQGMIRKDKTILFKGMENFFNRVLYAKCECPQEFLDMVEHLKLCLKQEGIEIRDNHEFVPHMTIMKITRTVARATGKKYIAPWLYSQSQNIDFGTQVIDNINLCEMGISRESDGFYITPGKLEI